MPELKCSLGHVGKIENAATSYPLTKFWNLRDFVSSAPRCVGVALKADKSKSEQDDSSVTEVTYGKSVDLILLLSFAIL